MKKSESEKWIWWKHGVIYHIYPRSFYDSDNDGIGDIKGIIQKLDYLKNLGVDAMWLSPIYKSPQFDFGYDVSDYRNIDPIFGNIKEFQRLISEAHKRKIRIIMDLIMNHTSNQHPWFVEASSSQFNAKRKWYIWTNGTPEKPPNNWKSCVGGSAWEYQIETGQYYYHSFFKEQPDLNWRNKELQNEFFDIVEYWLNMGVDGFRIDVANLIIKDKNLRNNPRFGGIFSEPNKIYTRNRPRSIKTIKDLRNLIDKYNKKVLIGEIYTLPPGSPELAAQYLGSGNNGLHMAFDFSLIFKQWSAKKYAQTIERWYKTIPANGWPCNVLSNHDLLRSYNRHKLRFNKNKKAVISAFLLLTLRGTPFIYYGEEIGMQNIRISHKYIKDPLGKILWPFYLGRDKARSPMQWNKKKNAGFTNAKPWLPIHSNFRHTNVEIQNDKKRTLLWYYRKLIKIRGKFKALHSGNFEMIENGKNGILAYKRIFRNHIIIVMLNFTCLHKHIAFTDPSVTKILLSTHRKSNTKMPLTNIRLKAFEATIALITNS